MKIHFTTTFSNDRQTFDVGPHYEVGNADAMRYIEAGFARKSPEPLPITPAVPEAGHPSPLKANEHVGTAADTKLPDAPAIDPAKGEQGAHNPAAFADGDGKVTPSTGFTTSNPDEHVSPPSDGASPLAGPGTPEAVKKSVPAVVKKNAAPAV